MNVDLVNTNCNWLETIWASARTCKSDISPKDLYARDSFEKPDADKIRLVKALKNAGHLSVFEHAHMTFAIEGVSRVLLAQITRHRHLSFSVESQRYVKMTKADFVMPQSFKGKKVGLVFEQMDKTKMRVDYPAEQVYEEYCQNAVKLYEELLHSGFPAEDARFVLPMGIACNCVISCNLRSLIELHEKRVAVKGAQWEVKEMVERMKHEITESMPWTECLF